MCGLTGFWSICNNTELMRNVKEKLSQVKEILYVFEVDGQQLSDEKLIRKYLFEGNKNGQ